MFAYEVTEADLYQRADLVIQREVPQLSRSFIKKLADEGKLLFAARTVAAGYKLKTIGELTLDYDLKRLNDVPQLDLDVIFEDDELVIVNKPSGVIVHARGRYWDEASIASALRRHCHWDPLSQPATTAELRAGIVHRLDRGTSGVLICAKTHAATAELQRQFSEREVEKTYFGIISATTALPGEGLIDKPIGRNPRDPKRFKTARHGRPAQTSFKIVATTGHHRLLEIKPLTGRTHQIRLHLASIGVPVLGDPLYKGAPAPRLMLHAGAITFGHPGSGERLAFSVPLPDLFKETMDNAD